MPWLRERGYGFHGVPNLRQQVGKFVDGQAGFADQGAQ
jgi:hypothetical protein